MRKTGGQLPTGGGGRQWRPFLLNHRLFCAPRPDPRAKSGGQRRPGRTGLRAGVAREQACRALAHAHLQAHFCAAGCSATALHDVSLALEAALELAE